MISRLALRVLAWVIVAYRRVLSGRGPMRQVRCSFAPGESCSAYGLRAVRESATACAAIAKIVRRLRRCRDACLVGDGRVLSWTPLHDRTPSEIAHDMRRDGERPPAIARMLATRRVVAVWCHDHRALVELAALTAAGAGPAEEMATCGHRPPRDHTTRTENATSPGPTHERHASPHKPTVCSTRAIERRARRRIAVRVVLAVAIAIALHAHPALDVGTVTLAAVTAVVSVRALAVHRRRFTLHASLARR